MENPDFLKEFDKETDQHYRWFHMTEKLTPRIRQYTENKPVSFKNKGLSKRNNFNTRKRRFQSSEEKPLKNEKPLKLVDKTSH